MPIRKVISETRVPIKIWTDDVEDEALKQLGHIAALPFVFKHVAAMPDVHAGKGATVGSVIATKRAISPAAVGVDIGCGMMAVKTSLDHRVVQEKIDKIYHSITRSIPVSHHSHKEVSSNVGLWPGWGRALSAVTDAATLQKSALQCGTLGGGNHFIELCLDETNAVWIMLHSGSRYIGKAIAERHIDKAKGFMRDMFISLPDPDLAYFAESQQEFKDYVSDVEWAQEYAFENRREMMRRIKKDLAYAVYGEMASIGEALEINCHHNYISREHHFGENVIVTRKGAIRARKDEYGIVPGSMGTCSYIVKGLGNDDSFHSCSHGAGRRMSRTKARANFTVDDLTKQTEGVKCRKDEGVLDEIPGAYKCIDKVMENSSDLVEIVAKLKQFMCIKG